MKRSEVLDTMREIFALMETAAGSAGDTITYWEGRAIIMSQLRALDELLALSPIARDL